jgi:methylenetetrahydrofolate reductase (NADPH)
VAPARVPGTARTFSFEFFPPQTPEGAQKLRITRKQLAQLKPAFFSVTFGAGGSTRDRTMDTVLEIQAEGHQAAPHVSCIAATKTAVCEMLQRYRQAGIRRVVALRGDMPSGMVVAGEFRFANELVAFIRQEFGSAFHIEVAAYPEYHPQARTAQEDLANFKRKVEAGADSAMTQYFFNPDAYFAFVDECQAADIPRWIRRKLEGFGDDSASIRSFGLDVVTQLCDQLLRGGAPGLHFYTLNQAGPTTTIWQRLGLS